MFYDGITGPAKDYLFARGEYQPKAYEYLKIKDKQAITDYDKAGDSWFDGLFSIYKKE